MSDVAIREARVPDWFPPWAARPARQRAEPDADRTQPEAGGMLADFRKVIGS